MKGMVYEGNVEWKNTILHRANDNGTPICVVTKTHKRYKTD